MLLLPVMVTSAGICSKHFLPKRLHQVIQVQCFKGLGTVSMNDAPASPGLVWLRIVASCEGLTAAVSLQGRCS